MPKTASLLVLAVCAGFATAASATAQMPGQPIAAAPVDPAIAQALATISPEQVHADIEKLVSFGNRSTLSSMDTDLPPGTGITAAADWLFGEFTKISEACGGCLEVKRDDFIEPASTGAGGRVSKPTRLQNIYAVLKGTDPAQANRRVLVTGHYDSRGNDNFDTHNPAPGANDDGSGTAVSLESARALSKLKFPATIVFLTVPGEEQGLLGSRHLAKLAKAEGWDLEAVLNNDIVGGDTTPGWTGADKTAVRVFSEGVPGPTTLQQLAQIQTYGMESDSPSRELARAIAEVAATYFRPGTARPPARPGGARSDMIRVVPAFHRGAGVPARSLRARRRPYQLQRRGLCGGAVYGVAGELRPPAPDAADGRGHAAGRDAGADRVWRLFEVCGYGVCGECGAAELGLPGDVRVGAGRADGRAYSGRFVG